MALLWPFRPNWQAGYRTSLQYKSEIITSRSGKEQRRSLRITPRKTIEHEVLVKGDSYIDLKRMLTRWQNNQFIVPEITRSLNVTTDIASGTSIIPVSSVPFWAVAGRDIVIQTPINAFKWQQSVHTIQTVSVGASTITITNATDFAWAAGTTVHPALLCLMEPQTALTPISSTVASMTVRFNVDPTDEPNVVNPTSFLTFDGREVLTQDHNWTSSPTTDFIYPFEQIDFGRGAIETIRPILFSTQSRRLSLLAKTATEVEEILAHFARAKGQRGEFFLESGEPDIIPSVPTPAGNFQIRVAGRDVFDTYANDTVHKALLFKMANGINHFTKVQSITLSGSDSIITLQSALSQIVSQATILRISWVRLSRHATDEITIDWVSDSVAQTQVTVRTLEYDTAETQIAQNGVALGAAIPINIVFTPGIPTRNVTQAGAALTVSTLFAPGAGSTTGNGSANGANYTVTASFGAGAATGIRNGSASGGAYTVGVTFNAGVATAGGSGSASGAAYTVTASFAAGTATGIRNGSASGSAYTVGVSFAPGLATAGGSGSASGANYTVTASFAAGNASGVRNGSAAGGAYTVTATFGAGVASGVRNATASGAAYTVTVTFAAGVASGSGSTQNTAMVAGRMVAAGMVGG